MAHEELLAGSAFFAETPADVLGLISASGETKNLQRGDVLFNEGDTPEFMYIVLSGRIAIAIGNRPLDSRESMLALMERGDLFGELALLDNGKRSAMARAIEPSSVMQIPYLIVRKHLQSNPSMLWGVTKLLATRLRVMDEVLSDSVFLDALGTPTVGLMGFCMGGMYCFNSARSARFNKIVSFYGMIKVPLGWQSSTHAEPLDYLQNGNADRVLAIIGGKDHYTPPADVAELKNVGVRTEIYPEAEHGFAHDASRPAHRHQDSTSAFAHAQDWLVS